LKNIRGALVLFVLFLNTVLWFIPLISFAILRGISPKESLKVFFNKNCSQMASMWVSCNSFIFSTINKTKWSIKGNDQLTVKNWYLILANHLSWVDIIVLQTVLNKKVPFLKFFIKRELFWLPFLGIAWWALDMPFMQRYSKSYLEKFPNKKGKDIKATKKACKKFQYNPTSVINFVEGTRCSDEKLKETKSPFRNLLTPKAGGISLALSSMGKMFNEILDITIVYPDGTVSFWDLLCGRFDRVIVDIKKIEIEDWMLVNDYHKSNQNKEKFHQWLNQLWQEKDNKISEIKHGFL